MAQQKIDTNILLIGGIFIGSYYFIIKPILEKLGLKETADEKEAAKKLEEQEKKLNIWGGLPTMIKAAGKGKTLKVLTVAGADSYAKQINSAFSVFGDDEDQINGVFRNLRYKTQVGSLVTAYFKLFKKDLLSDLKSRLSESELNSIISIIETKPSGIENK
jgi:hypothetical protein